MASILQQEVAAFQLIDYTSLVVVIVVGYDYLLTFLDEIEYIWTKPWTLVSTLYILTRYAGPCYLIIDSLLGTSFLPGPAKACYILNIFQIWALSIFVGATDLVMILRVWVLYKKSRFILGALLLFYGIEVILLLVNCVMLEAVKLMAPVFVQIEVLGFTFCEMQFGASQLATWVKPTIDIVQVILGTLMCLLLAIRFVKQSLQIYRATKRFETGHYLSLLVREGMFYYLAVLSYAIMDLLSYLPSSSPWWWISLDAILQNIPAITLAPRFVLTLQKLYARLPSRRESDIDTPDPFSSMDSNRDEGGTFLFESSGQDEGLGQGEEIVMVEREMPIAGPSHV